MKKILAFLILMGVVSIARAQVSSVVITSIPGCVSPGQTVDITFIITDSGNFSNVNFDVYFSPNSTLQTGAWSSFLKNTIICPTGTSGGFQFNDEGQTATTITQSVQIPASGFSGYIIVAAVQNLTSTILCTSVQGNASFGYPCTPTNTATQTDTQTATNSPTATATNTATQTATNTFNHTATYTNTATSTATNTATQTATNSATNTVTNTFTSMNTATQTATNTATQTATNTATNSATNTASQTATNTATNTATKTATQTATNTATVTATNTWTNTETAVYTQTPTATPTQPTPTITPTPGNATYYGTTSGTTTNPAATPSYYAFIPAPGNNKYPVITNGMITNGGGPTTPVNVGLVASGNYIWGPFNIYTQAVLGPTLISNYAGQPVSLLINGPGTILGDANYQYQIPHP